MVLGEGNRNLRTDIDNATATVGNAFQALRTSTREHSTAIQGVLHHTKSCGISLQRIEELVSNMKENFTRNQQDSSTHFVAALQTISDQVATLNFAQTSQYEVAVEGENFDQILLPLQLMKSRLGNILERVAGEGYMLAPESAIGWFQSELRDLTQYAYKSNASPARKLAVVADGQPEMYDLGRQILTVPFYRSGFVRSPSGFLVVEQAEGYDDRNRKIQRFRFACFATQVSDLRPSGVAGLFTRYQPEADGQKSYIQRHIRVIDVLSSKSEAFCCARNNNVARMKHLFATGRASPLHYTERGSSLLAVRSSYPYWPT